MTEIVESELVVHFPVNIIEYDVNNVRFDVSLTADDASAAADGALLWQIVRLYMSDMADGSNVVVADDDVPLTNNQDQLG